MVFEDAIFSAMFLWIIAGGAVCQSIVSWKPRTWRTHKFDGTPHVEIAERLRNYTAASDDEEDLEFIARGWTTRRRVWIREKGTLQVLLWLGLHWGLCFIGLNDIIMGSKDMDTMGEWAYAFFFVTPVVALASCVIRDYTDELTPAAAAALESVNRDER